MADFSPNMGDGELFLPSDIYPDELSANFGSPEVFPSELTYMEELAQQLSSLALLDRPNPQPTPKPPFPPYFEHVRPLFRPQLGFGAFPAAECGRQNLGVFGNGAFCAAPRPFHQLHPLQPFPVQVEQFVHGRGRPLQRQQSQGPDQFSPFRASGSGLAGSVRGSCGTGVFLPRVCIADPRRKSARKKGGEGQKMGVSQENRHEKSRRKATHDPYGPGESGHCLSTSTREGTASGLDLLIPLL